MEIISASSFQDCLCDAVVIVSEGINSLTRFDDKLPIGLRETIENFSKVNHSLDKGGVSIISPGDKMNCKRIIYASTGSVHKDFDDVRRYLRAGIAAGQHVLIAGSRSPILVTLPSERFPHAQLLASIGFLHTLYTPLNIRQDEAFVSRADLLGVFELDAGEKPVYSGSLLKFLQATHLAMNVCRDIGDGDPQRMSPANVADYVRKLFDNSTIKVDVTDDPYFINKEYPLMAAVSRCANTIEEHRARLIWLEYVGGGDVTETLFLIGKGVTLDTGGTDLKVGGAMHGMSRDKYGSAVVAGFFTALNELKPTGIKVVGCMAMCRNSVGANSYTCDEIITSRSGKRVHINNTDAEGRLAMADVLADFRERALSAKNAHLMTIATLTGHVIIAYGHCAAAVDNGPARAAHYSEQLQNTGDAFGQPIEISRLSTDDFDYHQSETDAADLRQSDVRPSTQTPRAHMKAAAFMIRVSRLDENGLDSGHPLKFTQLDIGYAMGPYPKTSLPAPLLALIAQHILPRVKFT